MADAPQAKLPRDVRVDQIGYVDEVKKQYADDLKTAVKSHMLEDELVRVTGDAFEGLLVQGRERTVPPAKLLRMYEQKKITKAQFLACMKVGNEAADKLLGKAAVARMSKFEDAPPKLCVTRIKGVEITLVDALKQLNKTARPRKAARGRRS